MSGAIPAVEPRPEGHLVGRAPIVDEWASFPSWPNHVQCEAAPGAMSGAIPSSTNDWLPEVSLGSLRQMFNKFIQYAINLLQSWDHLGTISEPLWDHPGTVLGACLQNLYNVQLWDHLGDMFAKFTQCFHVGNMSKFGTGVFFPLCFAGPDTTKKQIRRQQHRFPETAKSEKGTLTFTNKSIPKCMSREQL